MIRLIVVDSPVGIPLDQAQQCSRGLWLGQNRLERGKQIKCGNTPARTVRDAVLSGPAHRSPVEAAEAARRRMQDPSYRVELERRRGRGSSANPTGRYEPVQRESFDDGWDLDEEVAKLPGPAETYTAAREEFLTHRSHIATLAAGTS